MINEKDFVSDSSHHVHLWVHNNGDNPRDTKWTLAITRNANDPFGQPLTNSWSHTGMFGQIQADAVNNWLRQYRCGGMYDNLRGKLVSYAHEVAGSSSK